MDQIFQFELNGNGPRVKLRSRDQEVMNDLVNILEWFFAIKDIKYPMVAEEDLYETHLVLLREDDLSDVDELLSAVYKIAHAQQ